MMTQIERRRAKKRKKVKKEKENLPEEWKKNITNHADIQGIEMKITKDRLKQIIKEELEVTLTNEEAGELFGYEVQEELEQQETIEEQEEDLVMVKGYCQLLRRQVKRKLAEMLREAAEDALEGKYPHLDGGVIQALHAALRDEK